MPFFTCGRSGSWWVRSKSDPRWDGSGNAESCGGFTMPYECSQHIEELKKKFGEPPEDLEYGYMKD